MYVKRMTQQDKLEANSIVAAHNELDHENAEVMGYTTEYKLEKLHDSWVIAAYFSDGGREAGALVRCPNCHHITDIWGGQLEFCPTCWLDF